MDGPFFPFLSKGRRCRRPPVLALADAADHAHAGELLVVLLVSAAAIGVARSACQINHNSKKAPARLTMTTVTVNSMMIIMVMVMVITKVMMRMMMMQMATMMKMMVKVMVMTTTMAGVFFGRWFSCLINHAPPLAAERHCCPRQKAGTLPSWLSGPRSCHRMPARVAASCSSRSLASSTWLRPRERPCVFGATDHMSRTNSAASSSATSSSSSSFFFSFLHHFFLTLPRLFIFELLAVLVIVRPLFLRPPLLQLPLLLLAAVPLLLLLVGLLQLHLLFLPLFQLQLLRLFLLLPLALLELVLAAELVAAKLEQLSCWNMLALLAARAVRRAVLWARSRHRRRREEAAAEEPAAEELPAEKPLGSCEKAAAESSSAQSFKKASVLDAIAPPPSGSSEPAGV